MKFKVKVQIGVAVPGFTELTRRNKETSIEAETLEDATAQAVTFAKEKFPAGPDAYASYQIVVALDTGKAAE